MTWMTCKRDSSIYCCRPSWNLFSYLLYHILSLLPCQLLLKGTFATRAIYHLTAKALFPTPPGLPLSSPLLNTSYPISSTLLFIPFPPSCALCRSLNSLPSCCKAAPLKPAMDLGSVVISPNVVWSKATTSRDFVVFLEGKVHLASAVASNLNWAQRRGTESTEI